jgi:hypothetical protein
MDIETGRIYQRKNGDICRVSDIALDTENDRYLIIFQKNGDIRSYAMPADDFKAEFTEMPLNTFDDWQTVIISKLTKGR